MKLNKVLLGIVISACTYSVQAGNAAPVIDMNGTVTTANGTQTSVIEQLTLLSRKLESRNKAQVNLQRQLDDLYTEVSEIRGLTEQHSHQLGKILDRQRELYQELDRRVTEALSAQPPIAVAPVASTNSNMDYSNDLTENESYDHAVNLVLKEKKYTDAIPAFQQFIKQFPQSSYAANAHYWLGQLLFNKGDLNAAQKAFETVSSTYKTSPKRADALLKLGMIAQKSNNNVLAVDIFQQLIKEYPSSTPATLAKPRLEGLR
jgi:tol-pal system protein YbgF